MPALFIFKVHCLMFLLVSLCFSQPIYAAPAIKMNTVTYLIAQNRAEFDISSDGTAKTIIKINKGEELDVLKSLRSNVPVSFAVAEVPGDANSRTITVSEGVAFRLRYSRVIDPKDAVIGYNLDTKTKQLSAIAIVSDKSGANADTQLTEVVCTNGIGILTFKDVKLTSNGLSVLNTAQELKDRKLEFERQSYLRVGNGKFDTVKTAAYAVAKLIVRKGTSHIVPPGSVTVFGDSEPKSFKFDGVLKNNDSPDIYLEADPRLTVAPTAATAGPQNFSFMVEVSSIDAGSLVGPVWQYQEQYKLTNNSANPITVRIGESPVEEFAVQPDGKPLDAIIRLRTLPDTTIKVDLLSIKTDAELATVIAALANLRVISPQVSTTITEVKELYGKLQQARAELVSTTKRRDTLTGLLEDLRPVGGVASELDGLRRVIQYLEDEISSLRQKEPQLKLAIVSKVFPAESFGTPRVPPNALTAYTPDPTLRQRESR